MKYIELTSSELKRAASRMIAVLPVAAVEQHGRHLPVGTDSMLAGELGGRLERARPRQVLLLPVVTSGSSHHHKDFPGALSLNSGLFTAVVIDLVECLLATGFHRIFILNGHGGNHTPLAEALYQLNLRHPEPRAPWIVAANYWDIAARELNRQTFMATPRLSHACEYETSMMQALHPSLVRSVRPARRSTLLRSKFYDPLNYVPSRITLSQSFAQLTERGDLGSPEFATAEKGERLFQLFTRCLTEFISDFSQWPHPKQFPRPRLSPGRSP